MNPTTKLTSVFDSSVGDVRTRFIDMPVNKESLSNNNGLDFSRCLAFMSDTTNVMKGARSGVQKLIKNEE